jgi:dGTPase
MLSTTAKRAPSAEAHRGVPGPGGTRLAGSHDRYGPIQVRQSLPTSGNWQDDAVTLRNSKQLARLRGVTQVHVAKGAHSNRYEHSLEVAVLARNMAEELGLDATLAEAIGLGHDCGHVPFGHVGEDAVRKVLPSFDHADWGAFALADLELAAEVVDGVRSHSWHRPSPRTPEADLVRWSDRISYVTRDFRDACLAGLTEEELLPERVRLEAGVELDGQRQAFCSSVVDTSRRVGFVCMTDAVASALCDFRSFNFRTIYTHPTVTAQGDLGSSAIDCLLNYELTANRAHSDGTELVAWLARLDDEAVLDMVMSVLFGRQSAARAS